MSRPLFLVACAASSLCTAIVHAHHSPAAYDLTREVVVTGTVADIAWKNPHSYLTIETIGSDGAPYLQAVELDGPSAVQTSGLTRDMLAPGTRVDVRAMANRRGAGHIVLGVDLTTSDGAVYPLGPRGRSTARPAPEPAESLAGRWAPTPTGFGALARDLLAGPLTEAARAAQADIGGILDSAAGCTPYPQPLLMALNVLHTIELRPDVVTIDIDWMNASRTIHLDRDGHPPDVEPTPLGHSLGRWEGDTLVVETTGFAPHRQGITFGVPSGPRKRMTERLSLTEDRRHLRYEVILEDPDYLEQPVSVEQLWEHRPDLAPTEACDPGIARRFLED
jgi:hypothetical protein